MKTKIPLIALLCFLAVSCKTSTAEEDNWNSPSDWIPTLSIAQPDYRFELQIGAMQYKDHNDSDSLDTVAPLLYLPFASVGGDLLTIGMGAYLPIEKPERTRSVLCATFQIGRLLDLPTYLPLGVGVALPFSGYRADAGVMATLVGWRF